MGTDVERRVKHSSSMTLPLIFMAIAAVILAGGGYLASILFEWEQPTIKLLNAVPVLGQKTKIVAQVSDRKSGLREVRVVVRQGKKEAVLVERQLGRSTFLSKGVPSLEETIEINAPGVGLSDGKAEIMIIVRDLSWWQWLRGNQAQAAYPVVVDTKPPRLRLIEVPTGIKPGGSGIIVYGADKELVQSGVTIDGVFHPGFLIPTRKDRAYGAMIGIPYDTEVVKEAAISAIDHAGNEARQPVAIHIRPVKKKTDSINLSDGFLNDKIPEFALHYPEMKGSLIDQFLYVNNEVRKQNAERIREICSRTDPERHWQGRFVRMDRSSPMAGFAQYRSYFYQGKEVDNQVHLGVDLASLKQAEVKAANNGRVVFADYLGIYGNMVIIDHGQGVFSLYSHLSEIRAKAGDQVKTEDVVGMTGTTGMAGGDHLHFAMLINGIMVTPVEWWDEHWIKDNVLLFMQEHKDTP